MFILIMCNFFLF